MFSALWNVAGMIAGGTRDVWQSASTPGSADTSPPDTFQTALTKTWLSPTWPTENHADAGFSDDSDVSFSWTGTGTGNNRLFIQLMDDLDDLTTNTPSAHRRRKAREMFSDWIFSADMHGHSGNQHRDRQCQLRRSSAAEFGLRRPELSLAKEERAMRRSSGDFSALELPMPKISPEHRAVRCRSGDFTDFDVTSSPKVSPQHQSAIHGHLDKLQWLSSQLSGCYKENEDDSGYHTGSGTVLCTPRSPGQRTLTREDCRRRIKIFNSNNHGLIMEPPQDDNDTFHGSIRVHMNLIRPINMCISLPPSIYDVCHATELKTSLPASTGSVEMTSFHLPKDTSKVIHITSTTTTQEVIKVLLAKFHITDHPRKFALYEKVQEMGQSARMRRLCDDELPLQLCLSWTDNSINNLDLNQFVLQQNDTGEILWEAFSLPELESFLSVLNREEDEYVEQLRTKYRLLKVHTSKRLHEFESAYKQSAGGRRKSGFV